jgi:hypothetical protein
MQERNHKKIKLTKQKNLKWHSSKRKERFTEVETKIFLTACAWYENDTDYLQAELIQGIQGKNRRIKSILI